MSTHFGNVPLKPLPQEPKHRLWQSHRLYRWVALFAFTAIAFGLPLGLEGWMSPRVGFWDLLANVFSLRYLASVGVFTLLLGFFMEAPRGYGN